MRTEVEFLSDGTRCSAWFYQPAGEGPFVTIVMEHGLAAIKEMRLDAYAERFSQAGYACLLFDYRYFGASDGKPRQLLEVKCQHQDWEAAIAHARTLDCVDPEKIVLWGSSFSGGHVIVVAADDPRIAAVISQVPHLNGPASLGMVPLKNLLALTIKGLYDKVRSLLGMDPHYVLSSAEPGELALMTAPGESKGYLNLVPPGMAFDRRVAARIALKVVMYSPARKLPKLDCPVLMQIGKNDVTTPPKPALDAGKRVSNISLKVYDTGHFQPYVEPIFSTIIQDQIDFLTSELGKVD